MSPHSLCAASGCDQSLPQRHWKFCHRHSRLASTIWKRNHRAALRVEGIASHLEYFRTVTNSEAEARAAYNDYRRNLRRRRRRQRLRRVTQNRAIKLTTSAVGQRGTDTHD